MPSGPGVRVDTAARAGQRVPPDYDPLIAKILVVDESREAALARLSRALDETVVTGVQTTLPFHRYIARDGPFREGPLPIDWVDEHWAEELGRERDAALRVAERAAARWAASPLVPAGRERSVSSGASPGRSRAPDSNATPPSAWVRSARPGPTTGRPPR